MSRQQESRAGTCEVALLLCRPGSPAQWVAGRRWPSHNCKENPFSALAARRPLKTTCCRLPGPPANSPTPTSLLKQQCFGKISLEPNTT